MKKIAWITADYFLDVDIPLVNEMSNYYEIEWIVIYNKTINKNVLNEYGIKYNIKILFAPLLKKSLNPLNLVVFLKLLLHLKKKNPTLIYFDLVGFPYFHLIAFFILNPLKIVHAAHNVIDYKGWSHRWLMNLYIKFVFSHYCNFQFYSKYLETYFNKKYKNKKTFYSPFALKEFGEAKATVPKNQIHVLFFGTVKSNKRLDILITAVQRLSDDFANKIHITIAGQCSNPSYYLKLILKPKLFTIKFERIPDKDIPDLFCSNHYLILPYENVAQSGPHMIAYTYNIPVIASDIDGFKERIIDKQNGYLFKVNDVEDLKRILEFVITSHDTNYQRIKSNLEEFAKENYSLEKIVSNYKSFFDKIINKE